MNAPAMLSPSVPTVTTCPKRATDADRLIGRRIAILRRGKGLSQSALGQALGLTFQQIQKYEKGSNRVGAVRLQDIAHIFGVPVATFFETSADAPDKPVAIDCLAVTGAPELLRIFAGIESTTLRQHVLDHARATAQLGHHEGLPVAAPRAGDA